MVLDVAGERGQSIVMWDFEYVPPRSVLSYSKLTFPSAGDTIGLTAEKSNDLYAKLARKHPTNVLALNHDVKRERRCMTLNNICFNPNGPQNLPRTFYILSRIGPNLILKRNRRAPRYLCAPKSRL